MITKAEALAKLNARDTEDYTKLTARVEGVLPAYNGQTISVDVSPFSAKAIERVMADARKAGWSVKEQWGDQRDAGHWLEFS